MPSTTTATIAADLQTYFASKLLKQAKFKTVLDQFGLVEPLPSASSKTIQFTQYADLDIAIDPLTEGVAPAGKALSNTPITATVDQLGDFTKITDLAGLTPKHPIVQKALKLLGDQAAKSYDRSINNVVAVGTAVRYAGGAASRAALVAGSKIVWADIRKEVTRLKNSGAEQFEDGKFVLVVDPSVEQDLMDDATFEKAAIAHANKSGTDSELYKGVIAQFAGVTVVSSNHLKTVPAGAGDALTGHISLLFATDAYAITDLQKVKTYKQGPGGVTDPLEQVMTLGWKLAFKAAILNNNFMSRIESISEY